MARTAIRNGDDFQILPNQVTKLGNHQAFACASDLGPAFRFDAHLQMPWGEGFLVFRRGDSVYAEGGALGGCEYFAGTGFGRPVLRLTIYRD
jgi:hypothetical protein